MKEEHDERPFADILAEIFGTDPLHIANLYRLSDMEEAEENLFWQGWTAVSDERRQAIVRHLADIVEDNFMVDFSPIFARSLQDAQPEVRVAALDGLWDATDLKMIPVITRLLQEDPDVQVRAAAAGSLGHYVLLAEWANCQSASCPN